MISLISRVNIESYLKICSVATYSTTARLLLLLKARLVVVSP